MSGGPVLIWFGSRDFLLQYKILINGLLPLSSFKIITAVP